MLRAEKPCHFKTVFGIQQAAAGYSDNLNIGVVPAQLLYQLEPVFFRHQHIGYDQIEMPGAGHLQAGLTVGGSGDRMACLLKNRSQQLRTLRIIIYYEYCCHGLSLQKVSSKKQSHSLQKKTSKKRT